MLKIKLQFCIALLMLISSVFKINAIRYQSPEDKEIISRYIEIAADSGGTLGDRMVAVAKAMEGTLWAPPADNDSIGTIKVNIQGLDRLSFINNVVAIAEASFKTSDRLGAYEAEIEKVSRRKGIDDGFTSQLFYGSEWIVDNTSRGVLKEMTEYLTGGSFKTKTLDYRTRHKAEFPALKDSAQLEKMRMIEMGYRSHRIPHLKKQSAGNKSVSELMQPGDIIMMLSPEVDYDMYDIGVVDMKEGMPYLIHISHTDGKVTVDDYPISRLFKLEGQHFYGYRWLRPVD